MDRVMHSVCGLPVYGQIKEDKSSPTYTYVGYCRKRESCDNEPIWLIYREYSSGLVKHVTYASEKFDKAWSKRTEYFETLKAEDLDTINPESL